jgi:FKBP-type peptidyl-prolyl cis-trans isomerase
VALAFFTAACDRDGGGSPTDPSQVNIEFTTTDITVGTGPQAAPGNFVSTNYTLWLYNGSGTDSKGAQLETSIGRAPLDFVIGASNILSGYQQGIVGMRIGGKRRVYVPANMAYGSQPPSGIPPNAALVFEIDLVNLVQ